RGGCPVTPTRSRRPCSRWPRTCSAMRRTCWRTAARPRSSCGSCSPGCARRWPACAGSRRAGAGGRLPDRLDPLRVVDERVAVVLEGVVDDVVAALLEGVRRVLLVPGLQHGELAHVGVAAVVHLAVDLQVGPAVGALV